MTEPNGSRLPAGRPPWDPWNGARVGILVGGLVSVGVVLLLGLSNYWLVPIGGVIGGVIGYWSQKRKQTTNAS